MAETAPASPQPTGSPPAAIKAAIRAQALALGFDAVGFTAADLGPGAAAGLARYLAHGHHGEMDWMARRQDERAAPRRLWPAARSAVVLGVNYGPAEDPLDATRRRACGAISVYARNRDYHDAAKKRLRQLARWMAETFVCEVKLFVDTAPVMEKPLAERGGLGWQGKHTNLVSREFGSWLFLAEVLTDLALPPDEPESDHCGSCRACLDACPTAAFPAPGELDARRCISYLTIEHKGHIAAEFRVAIGNRIYGCDDCLAVCPWNKYAQQTRDLAFQPRADLIAPRLAELATLDDAAFRALFAGSPIKRIGRDRFVRNVLIAIGNADDPALTAVAEPLTRDASPLVRAMAIWALSRLLSAADFTALRARLCPTEPDSAVRGEWQSAA